MKLSTLLILAGLSVAAADTIPEVATADDRFKTLVAALSAADLVDTLAGAGPFTVFAPVDDAFADLPDGLVDCLLETANKSTLASILKHHVVSGKVMAADVTDDLIEPSLEEKDLTFSVDGDVVMVNGATVIVADVMADNGVIHAIDKVLVPEGLENDACFASPGTIPEVATADDRFKTLVAALGAADLVDTLAGAGPFTVFAPTDDAFAALPDGVVTCLLKPANKSTLASILKHHVVSGKVMAADVTDDLVQPSLEEKDLTFNVDGGVVMVNEATIIVADVMADNGVIHAIDGVLLPEGAESTTCFLEVNTKTTDDNSGAMGVSNSVATMIVSVAILVTAL